jgi:hypothetical protein
MMSILRGSKSNASQREDDHRQGEHDGEDRQPGTTLHDIERGTEHEQADHTKQHTLRRGVFHQRIQQDAQDLDKQEHGARMLERERCHARGHRRSRPAGVELHGLQRHRT